MLEAAVREVKEGVTISVHVVPRASRSGLAGMHGDRLRIRVKAPPVEGAANKEVLRILAELLFVPASYIELMAGAGSREKLVLLRGLTLAVVLARLKSAQE